jgi:parallel beta-helix repeat protein
VKRRVPIAVAALIALLALAAPANATHVQCGDVLTETTVLDSDLVCAGADESYVGITIAADNVTLWMNGHTMRSESGYGTGVKTDGTLSNIEVRRGSFMGWTRAIEMTASDSAVLKVRVSDLGYPIDVLGVQIWMVGDRNYAAHNFVDGSFYLHLKDDDVAIKGIWLDGDDAYTWGNTLIFAEGIRSRGDRPRHVLNTVRCGDFGVYGIFVADYTNGAVINRNTVSWCWDGITALGSGNVSGALIRLNHAGPGNTFGLSINDPKAIVGRNTANENADVGIASYSAGTTIQNNTANNNTYYAGIDAAEGTIDGGGNTATGNGDGSVPQCINVQCGP